MNLRPLSCLVSLLAVGASTDQLHAQTFIDGRVVDSLGAGVAGVDVDIKNIGGGGGTPNVLNDGTDANGFFHMTVLQTNGSTTYRVTFNPPQPPASTASVTEIEPVQVTLNTTRNMGTITLAPGATIHGRIVNGAGTGVAGVNLDVLDASGAAATLVYDFTDVSGNFAFNAPLGSTAVRFDTSTVAGQTLAPRELEIALAGDLDLGTQTVVQGFVVSAIVRNPSNVALANVNLDVFDAATGVRHFTPNNDTNAAGFVSVVVPGGAQFFDFFPLPATQLAPVRVATTVVANASLGIVVAPAGLALTGTIRNRLGAALAGIDIDITNTATGLEIPLANDFSGPTGAYSTLVPAGTYTVYFKPTSTSGYRADVHYATNVAATTFLDGALPPAYQVLCSGDGSVPTSCPCGNFGAPGHGCTNSFYGNGGMLYVDGATMVDPATARDTCVLHVANVPHSTGLGSIFAQKDSYDPNGAVYGDGVTCATGSLIRLGSRGTPTGVGQWPEPQNQCLSVRGQVTPGSGVVRYYYAYYRNAAASFCPPATFNTTNVVRIDW